MSTLTRKLAVVCLAVVFSVLVHGCGGGGSKLTPMSMSHTVSTDMVTTGLTIEPGTYTIQPGGNLDAGDATFTCPPGGVPCVVTVADDGTVTSAGGAGDGDELCCRKREALYVKSSCKHEYGGGRPDN